MKILLLTDELWPLEILIHEKELGRPDYNVDNILI